MDAARWEKEVRAAWERRETRLRSPDGWLALIERLWLEDGPNDTPIGLAVVRGSAVTLEVPPDLPVLLGGATVSVHTVRTADEPPGDLFTLGGRLYDFVARSGRMSIRVRDPEVARRADLSGLVHYPPDPRFRLDAVLQEHERRIAVPFSSDSVEERESRGRLVFRFDGAEHGLDVIEEADSPRLFVLFADPTNRDETYPAGRFVYTRLPDAQGHTVLDFNLALNPPCVWNPLLICPLPPPGNRLPFRVEAGEKRRA